jgi:DNA repair photolyase
MTAHPSRGRGTAANPDPRYGAQRRDAVVPEWPGDLDEDSAPLRTRTRVDATRTIIARNDSPDIPFDQSVNPYRGCEHGCIYCFARPSHAYLDLSPGLDFETEIVIKPRAADLLRDALAKPGYRCQVLAMGTNTDPYQPLERRHGITRAIVQLLAQCRHPLAITTKSARVARDLDLLGPMAADGLVAVNVSITTLNRHLAARLEPRAAAPQARLDTVRRLREAGVPCGVLVSPLIPALTDHELEAILEAARDAGAQWASHLLVRLPGEVAALFEAWLSEHYPDRAARVMHHIQESWGGVVNPTTFGARHHGQGAYAQTIAQRFRLTHRRLGFGPHPALRTDLFRPPERGGQLTLFA